MTTHFYVHKGGSTANALKFVSPVLGGTTTCQIIEERRRAVRPREVRLENTHPTVRKPLGREMRNLMGCERG
jgi:hypothetical protein